MRNIEIISIVAFALLSFSSAAIAQVPIAEYDHTNGSISFSQVVDVLVFRLESPSKLLRAGEITDLEGLAVPPFGAIVDNAPSVLEWGLITGLNFEDPISGGNVFPTGLTNKQLNSEFRLDYYGTVIGPIIPPIQILGGAPVPEPTAMVLSCLGLAAFAVIRNRS